ncbi:MAG: Fe-S protein assembly co-chaperone HscB [Proteobacteria bacterium]|nr:Fe-S protein assembly co-chaperone HscB [Pseudomonadota bacterium]
MIVCEACKKLQAFPQYSPNYFELFGLPISLEIEESSLRQSFYQLSQQAHPDTHSQTDDLNQLQAAKWSTVINKGFQTLKNLNSRLEYIFELNRNIPLPPSHPPMEIAESYFDLQETLSEGSNERALSSFLKMLEETEISLDKEWKQLVSEWEQAPTHHALLPRLKLFLDTKKYLNSLKSDLSKKRGIS